MGKAVGSHKFIENIRAEHYRSRYGYGKPIEIIAYRVFFMIESTNASPRPFAAKTALPYAGKIGIVVETVFYGTRPPLHGSSSCDI